MCLGNICRSPMAEGIFLHMARERGVLGRLDVDSCGLGDWHVGGPADGRTIAACGRRGVGVPSVARVWDGAVDAGRFDVIVAMDGQNYKGLLSRGAPRERVRMMREFEGSGRVADESGAAGGSHRLAPRASQVGGTADVPDPYTGPESGFDALFVLLEDCCAGLLREVERVL